MVTGKVGVPITITATGTNIQWISEINVIMRIALDRKSMSFTPSEKKVYKFTIIEDGKRRDVEVDCRDAASPTPTPEPEPTPTPTGTLWDSKVHTKLHDGKVRTITQEGSITANGKGVECRASGDPEIVVNADGTFSLVSGSGGVDNFSIKLRSRHNEGGDCEHRFGGLGCHVERDRVGMKTESCHNNHENSEEVSYNPSVFDNQFHTLEFQVKDAGPAIEQTLSIDGVQKLKHPHNSPKSFYLDKALYDKQSYLWLRINNSDHGRIYVYATNYNSKLTVVFKIEPSKNAVTFKDVKLIAV